MFACFLIMFGSSFLFGYNIGVLNQPVKVSVAFPLDEPEQTKVSVVLWPWHLSSSVEANLRALYGHIRLCLLPLCMSLSLSLSLCLLSLILSLSAVSHSLFFSNSLCLFSLLNRMHHKPRSLSDTMGIISCCARK